VAESFPKTAWGWIGYPRKSLGVVEPPSNKTTLGSGRATLKHLGVVQQLPLLLLLFFFFVFLKFLNFYLILNFEFLFLFF
jgi:hypothetical protein